MTDYKGIVKTKTEAKMTREQYEADQRMLNYFAACEDDLAYQTSMYWRLLPQKYVIAARVKKYETQQQAA